MTFCGLKRAAYQKEMDWPTAFDLNSFIDYCHRAGPQMALTEFLLSVMNEFCESAHWRKGKMIPAPAFTNNRPLKRTIE
jgi:hypothetical protein